MAVRVSRSKTNSPAGTPHQKERSYNRLKNEIRKSYALLPTDIDYDYDLSARTTPRTPVRTGTPAALFRKENVSEADDAGAEIRGLRGLVDELSQKNGELQQAVSDLEGDIRSLRQAKEQAVIARTVAEQEAEQLKRSIDELREEGRSREKRFGELERAFDRKQEAWGKLDKRCTELEAEVGRKGEQGEAERRRAEKAERELAKRAKEEEGRRRREEEREALVNQLKAREVEQQNTAATLQEQLAGLRRRLEESLSQKQDLATQLSEASTRRGELASEVDSLRGEVSTLRSREEGEGEEQQDRQADGREREREAVVVALRTRLAEAAERERELKEELQQVRTDGQRARAEVAKKDVTLAELHAQLSALGGVQGEVKESSRRERRAREEVEGLRLEAQRHKDAAAAGEARISLLEGKLEAATRARDEATASLNDRTQTLSERASALKQKDGEASRLQKVLEEQTAHLAEREERASTAEKEARRLEAQLQEATQEVKRLREEVNEREALEAALEGEVERLRGLLKGKGDTKSRADSQQAEEARRALREKEEVIGSLLERLEAFKDGLFAKERQLREQAARHAMQLQAVADQAGTQLDTCATQAQEGEVEEFETEGEGLPTHFQAMEALQAAIDTLRLRIEGQLGDEGSESEGEGGAHAEAEAEAAQLQRDLAHRTACFRARLASVQQKMDTLVNELALRDEAIARLREEREGLEGAVVQVPSRACLGGSLFVVLVASLTKQILWLVVVAANGSGVTEIIT